jgi:hypothetical protein
MKRAVTLLLGTLTVVACSRAERTDTTHTTGATTVAAPATTETSGPQRERDRADAMGGLPGHNTTPKHADDVRIKLMRDRPVPEPIIRQLTIFDDGGDRVAILGDVPDQATHDAVIAAAKATSGVKEVRDDLRILNR